jgi:hypothetical protein
VGCILFWSLSLDSEFGHDNIRNKRTFVIGISRIFFGGKDTLHHKVLTYIEYRAVSGIFRTVDPPPPLHPASVPSPSTKGTLAGR